MKKVGFHSYTYVRTNVMRSKLLEREDYAKLLKMSVSEITRYLQDRHFEQEINELGAVHTSTELLETALMQNLNRAFQKLKRITQDNLLVLVKSYLQRFDVQNVKTVIRGVKTDRRDEAKRLIFDIGTRSSDFYINALQQQSITDALDILSALDIVTHEDNQVVVENKLDHNYYDQLLQTCHGVKGAELFERFVREEIRVTNVLTLLRLTKEGMDAETIAELLIPSDDIAHDLVGETLDDIFDVLAQTDLGEVISQRGEDGSLIPVERELQRYLLKKSRLFLHQDILSVNVILGYMFAKELEIRNLRTLVKGKRLNVGESFIKEELIT